MMLGTGRVREVPIQLRQGIRSDGAGHAPGTTDDVIELRWMSPMAPPAAASSSA